MRQEELFARCSISKAILRLAIPTVIGQMIFVLYNMADTFFVGLVGSDELLSAVTVCMPTFLFLSAIANLFGVGGASVVARAMGAGQTCRVGSAAAFSFWGCLTVTLLYGLAALLGLDGLVDLLGGTHPQVHHYARQYLLCTVIVGGAATSMSLLLSHLIRAEGRAVHASVGIALGGLLNIALDPLWMFVLLPPGQEALGAAIATTLSNFVSLVYFAVVLLVLRKQSGLGFRFSREMFCDRIPAEVMSAGIPACVMTLFENISYAVLDKLMSLSGVAYQAGIGVAKKINMLAHCVVRGIAQGALPLIAYNYSSRARERLHSAVRLSHWLAVGTAAVCTVASLLFARQLTGLFIRGTTDSLRAASAFLRILCLGAPLSASAYTVISFFQAVGEGRKSFLLAILRKGLVDIPLMFLLRRMIPIYGIVWATPLADGLCCLAAALLLRRYLARLRLETPI